VQRKKEKQRKEKKRKESMSIAHITSDSQLGLIEKPDRGQKLVCTGLVKTMNIDKIGVKFKI
jgi:hypothetical protein